LIFDQGVVCPLTVVHGSWMGLVVGLVEFLYSFVNFWLYIYSGLLAKAHHVARP